MKHRNKLTTDTFRGVCFGIKSVAIPCNDTATLLTKYILTNRSFSLIKKEATANDAVARFWSRAEREKKPAKRMVKEACYAGLPDHAD